jgi:uncharacterized protein (TIGR02117 family)
MKILKKIVKYTLRSALAFICFIALYLLSAFICKYITTNDDFVEEQDGVEVFLISNGVHADICLPLDSNTIFWSKYFDEKDFATLKNKAKFISFGWGDKGFFLDTPTWADLTAKTAIKALFIPSSAALHVSYLSDNPKLSETTKSFKINKAALKKMEQYIISYIQLKNNSPILIDCCRYPNVHDNFYEAKGKYHLFRTCNVWTNQVIKEAGVKTSIWSPFESSILHQFE